MTRSYETALLCGIAADLAAAGFGTWVDPDTGGAYPDGTERPIYISLTIADQDKGVWVLLADTELFPLNGQLTTVQILTRGAKYDTTHGEFDFAAGIAEHLTPRGYPSAQRLFGTVPVSRMTRGGLRSLPIDQNERPQTSQNYRARGRRFTV